MTDAIKGQCLCGEVQFEVDQVDELDVCHCHMCRRWTGGPYIGADVRGGVTLIQAATLTWYESSDWAKRGFCKTCGASLFYKLKADDTFWSIAGGALDLPDGLSISKEIFVDEKPDYYILAGEQKKLTGPEFLAAIGAPSDD